MRLLLNGTSFRITQMGPDFLFVDSPADLPPGRAAIEFQVDDSENRWNVHLPDGISAGSKRVALAATE